MVIGLWTMASKETQSINDLKRQKEHFCNELIVEISKYEAVLAKLNDTESANSDQKQYSDPLQSYTKQQLIDHINELRQQIESEEKEKDQDITNDISLNDARMTPIRLMLEFCVSNDELDGFKGVVIRAATVPIYQQLIPLMTGTDAQFLILPNESHHQLITALFPDQLATANDILRFISVLTLFNQERVRVSNISLSQWNEEQLPLSFMIYIANQVIREKAENEQKQNETKLRSESAISGTVWSFIHFLRRFCVEKQWNGIKLKEFWNDITENEFGNALAERVCSHFEVEHDGFATSIEMLPIWCKEELRRFKTHPVVLEDCTVKDIVTLLTFERISSNGVVNGVFAQFESLNGEDNDCLSAVMEWKEKMVEWVRNEGVDGKELAESDVHDMSLELANIVLPDEVTGSKRKTLKRALRGQFHSILNLCKNMDIFQFFEAVNLENDPESERKVTRFDALKQWLAQQHDVDEKEIDVLHQMVTENGYESETLLLSEQWMTSENAPWNQLECAPFIAPFFRDRKCVFTVFLCNLCPFTLFLCTLTLSVYCFDYTVNNGQFEIGFDFDLKAITQFEPKTDPGDQFRSRRGSIVDAQSTLSDVFPLEKD